MQRQRQKDKANATITLRVERPRLIDENGVESEEKWIEGFPWRAVLRSSTHRARPSLLVSLRCGRPDSCAAVWFAAASFDAAIVVAGKEFKAAEQDRTDYMHRYMPGEEGSGAFHLISLHSLLAPANGLLDAGSLTVRVTVDVKFMQRSPFRDRPKAELCGPSKSRERREEMQRPSDLFDCALKMGERRVYVSRQFLAFHSPVFRTLFFGDYMERNKDEVEMKDIDPDEFLGVLSLLYKTGDTIDVNNVESVLMLADRFDIKCLFVDCETFLLSLLERNGVSLDHSLLLAHKYNLPNLKELCLSSQRSLRYGVSRPSSIFARTPLKDASPIGRPTAAPAKW